MNIGKEAIEQIKIREWVIQTTDLPFYYFVNEGKRSIQNGMLLKRMGMVSGVSDIFIPRATPSHHGMWIELKVKPNKLFQAQKDFLAKMREEGYAAEVAYGADEAIGLIKRHYGLE